MPKIDESDLDVGNEPPFVARKVVIKRGQNPKLDYAFADELGRGRFGTVVKCTEKKTGLELAAKFVSTRMKEERENVEREVDIMKSLQHRRLLQLYDVYDDGASEICIITELINGGELFERVIDDDFELTEKVCAIFMRQIIEGVQYMHEKFIMHLDMKPENILCVTLTGNRIKLIDFGLARRFDPSQTLQVMFGTPDFAAPEVLSYERVTPAADMWSVGVICYVLLSGLSPFMGNSDLETMTNVTKAVYDFEDESFEPITEEAKDFIAKLLIKDPKRRLTPSQCLQHKWLAKTPAKRGKAPQLDKTKLKKYVVRRRWQKAVTAIMALSRMGANLSLTGASSAAKRSAPIVRKTTASGGAAASRATGGASRATPRGTSATSASTTSRTASSSAVSASPGPRTRLVPTATTSSSSSPAATTTATRPLTSSPTSPPSAKTTASRLAGATTTSATTTTTTRTSSSSSSSSSSTRMTTSSSLGSAKPSTPVSPSVGGSTSSTSTSTMRSSTTSSTRARPPPSALSPSLTPSGTSYRMQTGLSSTTRRRF